MKLTRGSMRRHAGGLLTFALLVPAAAPAVAISALLPAPTLSAPASGATNVPTAPTFSWSAVTGATKYWVTVATSSAALPSDPNAATCPGCVISCITTGTTHTPPTCTTGRSVILNVATTYFWEVQAFDDTVVPIREGARSTVFNFT